MKTEKYPLIYLEWCDAIESQAGWQEVGTIDEWAASNDWMVAECGFLIEETKEYLIFAGRKGDYQEDNVPKFGSIMKIPKTWVRKRVDLTKHTK